MQILVTENLLENVSCVDILCSKFHRSMCTSWSLLEHGYHYDRTCSPPAALSTLCSLHSGPNKVKQRHEYPRLSTSTRVLEKIPPKTREYPGFITLQISLVVVGREYRRGTRLKDMRWKIYFNIFFYVYGGQSNHYSVVARGAVLREIRPIRDKEKMGRLPQNVSVTWDNLPATSVKDHCIPRRYTCRMHYTEKHVYVYD